MIRAVQERVDSWAQIQSTTEFDRAVLRERFAELKRQLPWVYAVLVVNIVAVQLVAARTGHASYGAAAILVGIIVLRITHWLPLRAIQTSDAAIVRELRKTYIVSTAFFTASAAWTGSLCFRLGCDARINVAVLAGLASVGASCGLSSFPAAARIPLILLAIPLVAAPSGACVAAHAGIGLSLVILTLVQWRMLAVRDTTFTGLISSRFAVEAEKRRALEAERTAVDEKWRVTSIANSDPLTGIANRRGFLSAIEGIERVQRRKLGLILVDLDGFKPINDTFGHSSGDALLVEVSRRLRSLVGLKGPVARLGGDEFAFICECESSRHAIRMGECAIALLGKPFRLDGRDMRISGCAGVSYQGDDDVGEAIRRADIALFDAKRRGRGSVSVFSEELEREVQRRTSIEQALRAPGLASEIQLSFQPIFNLETMELASFEALARWSHPDLGSISPSEFIPITEQISVLHEFSSELLKRAAGAAAEWPSAVRLSFNLSAVELCSEGTAERVLASIAEGALDPGRLQIEVTETALLADFEVARRNLSCLRKRGVRIVLDDFGAGYSSISYLREMNFDVVKLDGSLVGSIGRSAAALPLLEGVLALCRAMGHQCVAEHIETPEQAELLRELGCRYGQGFALSPPVGAFEARMLAAANQRMRARAASEHRTAAA